MTAELWREPEAAAPLQVTLTVGACISSQSGLRAMHYARRRADLNEVIALDTSFVDVALAAGVILCVHLCHRGGFAPSLNASSARPWCAAEDEVKTLR